MFFFLVLEEELNLYIVDKVNSMYNSMAIDALTSKWMLGRERSVRER